MSAASDSSHLTMDAVMGAAGGVAVTHWPIPPRFIEQYKASIDRLLERHHFRGYFAEGPNPILLLNLDPGLDDAAVNSQPINVVPWGWPGNFGASLTLTCYFRATTLPSTATFFGNENGALKQFLSNELKFVFLRGRRPVAAFAVDFRKSEVSRGNLGRHIAAVRQHRPRCYHDESAHYWETLKCLTVLAPQWTAKDRLRVGWYKTYEENARGFPAWLIDFRERRPLPDGALVPPAIVDFVNLALLPTTDARTLLEHIHDRYGSTGSALAGFFSDWLAIGKLTEKSAEWEELFYFIGHAFDLYNLCPLATDCGLLVPWYDFVDHDFKKLELSPHERPMSLSPEHFWPRLPRAVVNYAWGRALRGNDLPLASSSLVESASAMPQADDISAVESAADALFDEALANKQGTIPRRAFVQLPFGPFTHIEMSEHEPNVLVVCRCESGEVCLIVCEPSKKYCSFQMPPSDGITDEMATRISAGVKLLLAAVIRDFWVVEHRESVFDTVAKRGTRHRLWTTDDQRIVYVPRVRYSPRPDLERCAATLDQPKRRAHFVQGHVRRSAAASGPQIDLARKFGVNVPQGYTFVRPHERGKGKRDVIYRSRSALQSLYTAFVDAPPTESLWFKFERDVKRLMDSLGFTVEHVAASRRGDGGIDVYATKGSGLDEVQWIIQCKCWKLSRKVYPGTVRELLGVLSTYPRTVRGLIVTTSSFSSGAAELARNMGILLMDGDEFARAAVMQAPL